MWVGAVELRDFRNHSHTRLTLEPGTTLFLGRNGQGKTNFIESLVVLSQLSSHRVSTDAALVRQGKDSAVIRASIHHDTRSVDLALEIVAKGANKAKINGDSQPVSALLGWVKVVLFAPEDLGIIRGDPSVRRRFIDDFAVSLTPSLHASLGQYEKILRQRNALLKTARSRSHAFDSEIDAWDDELATLSGMITRARIDAIDRLEPECAEAYAVISPGDKVGLRLDTSLEHPEKLEPAELEGAYRDMLVARRSDELERGMTLVGPHRDDVEISLGGLSARSHSSHGEAWSIALALKIAVAQCVRKDSSSGDPVIILDDVLAELDRKRRDTVTTLIADYEQVIITAAVEEDVPEQLSAAVFYVNEGSVVAGG